MDNNRFLELYDLIENKGYPARSTCKDESERSAYKRMKRKLKNNELIIPKLYREEARKEKKSFFQKKEKIKEIEKPSEQASSETVLDVEDMETKDLIRHVRKKAYTHAMQKCDSVSTKFLIDLYKLEIQQEAQERTYSPSDYREMIKELFSREEESFEDRKKNYEERVKNSISTVKEEE